MTEETSRTHVYHARRIHTMDRSRPVVDAVAVLGDRIVARGDLDEVRALHRDADVVDLGQVTVVPGLNDAHQHMSEAADTYAQLDLSSPPAVSFDDLVDRLRERVATTPAGEWVRVNRYDHMKAGAGRVVTRAELDLVSPEHPMLLVQVSGHWGVANSLALARLGIDEHTPPPAGGSFGVDDRGELDGRLFEEALMRVAFLGEGVPKTPLAERLDGFTAVQTAYHAAGLTSVGDALATPESIELYQEARRREVLDVRVNLLVHHASFDHLERLGLATGFGDEWLRIGGVKAFADGAVAGRTCLVTEPFEGTDDCGMAVMPAGELAALTDRVHRSGNRMAIHANGDRAIAAALDAFEAAQARSPKPHLRHRIEHCTIVTPELVDRMRRSGTMAVPFGSYVYFHGEKLAEWYGEQRLERMFAHRTLLDGGVDVAGSSDYPAGPFEPLAAIQSCVTRRASDGAVLGGSQRLSVAEALWLYTVGSARASGEEHRKGRLAPGQLADFVVLGADPEEVDPDGLAEIPVLATYVGGREVWRDATA